jgi:hypothetical protein
MTDNQLDEIFKKQLPGHESPVPGDMWERITRKKDKDRKGFFFFFSLIGLFLLGFGVAVILLFSTNKKGIKRNDGTINNSKVFSNADTVRSAGTGQDFKKNSLANQKTTFGGMDSVLTTANQRLQLTKRPPQHSQPEILQTQLKFQTRSLNTGHATQSETESTAVALKSEVSSDSVKKSSEKAIPVHSSTPKQISADSVKTSASKKSDSTKKNLVSKWSLDLYASPDYPIDHKPQEYIKGQLSYTVGLRLNRSFGKRFSAKIGIQFSQLNYVLPDSSASAGNYRLSRLDIPVLGGYSWGNETLGMTVNAGVIFNLYSKLGTGQFDYINSNTGLSLYLGFYFSKHVNKRIDIFSEPYYRYQLSSMVNSPNYFPKYIDVVGLSFGVRYHFKK